MASGVSGEASQLGPGRSRHQEDGRELDNSLKEMARSPRRRRLCRARARPIPRRGGRTHRNGQGRAPDAEHAGRSRRQGHERRRRLPGRAQRRHQQGRRRRRLLHGRHAVVSHRGESRRQGQGDRALLRIPSGRRRARLVEDDRAGQRPLAENEATGAGGPSARKPAWGNRHADGAPGTGHAFMASQRARHAE